MNLFSLVYISPVYHMTVYHLSRLLNRLKTESVWSWIRYNLALLLPCPKRGFAAGQQPSPAAAGVRKKPSTTDDEQARIRSPNDRDGQRAGTDKFQTEEADPPWQKEAYLTICSVFARMLIAVSVETRGLHVRSRNQSPV